MAAELTYMVNVELLKEGNDAFPEIVLSWNNKHFRIARGKSAFVPLEAAINAFGDPRSASNTVAIKEPGGSATGWVADRASEVARLRILWGCNEADRPNFDDIEVPKVHVTNLEGEDIITVLDDPSGESVIPQISTGNDKAALEDLLARQQEQIDQMRRELGMTDQVSAEEDLPKDDTTPPLFVGTGNGQ